MALCEISKMWIISLSPSPRWVLSIRKIPCHRLTVSSTFPHSQGSQVLSMHIGSCREWDPDLHRGFPVIPAHRFHNSPYHPDRNLPLKLSNRNTSAQYKNSESESAGGLQQVAVPFFSYFSIPPTHSKADSLPCHIHVLPPCCFSTLWRRLASYLSSLSKYVM